MIKTDILIIGAGPTGLFAVFEAGLFQFRIMTQSRRIPAVACIKLTPQKHRYNAKVRALTEGISDFSCSSGGHVPTHRPQREN